MLRNLPRLVSNIPRVWLYLGSVTLRLVTELPRGLVSRDN